MKLHYLQHEPHETPGSILDWAAERGHTLSSTMLFAGDLFPAQHEFDLLVIMGGSMSVYEENLHPWLIHEKAFIRRVIDAGKPVLGICLGAQLIASALGAAVYKNREKEIGWHSIELTKFALESPLFTSWPKDPMIFQWHGDTFDIPQHAEQIAKSKACQNQGFIYGNTTVALQFHPETRMVELDAFLETSGSECDLHGEFIQNRETIRAQENLVAPMRKLLFSLLDAMTDLTNR